MKGVILERPGGLEKLRLVEREDPGLPGPGEIRVRLRASSLNFHDYLVVTGKLPTEEGRIPMSDGAGFVEEVGQGVSEFSAGDLVVSCFFPLWQDGGPTMGDFGQVPGDGIDGYAREAVVAPASWFTRAPAGWTPKEAATLTTAALTAWRSLVVEGVLKAGDTVLVLGTGGVSIFALQIAKAMGARVIATSSSEAKLERLLSLGADQAINYRREPHWSKAVQRWTKGRGVDHVVEVGGPGTLDQSIRACRVGGQISLIGVLSGIAGEVRTALLMQRQIRLQGLVVGSRRHQIEMVRAMEATGIRPVIDRAFDLVDITDAFRYQESGKHFGKIALEF
ncbi:alcohol dehydrogenase, propanol-preferring [Methylacidimicrobium cyclopophantes]|uniref:Alcohol dehydrogenase, propanol-preferring n=1 Tax=Methylacidimicrobium cyclopophantes TaxID=1041766 RepID=A0A5E6MCT3_9BACT|nr:NAD(P)-dependent alcohol dehydrogenase [Methylacidimicrobium cyclopophantes]VVM06136.1 alcohol dehydrogenase, propanol-preferring [Methylacidimicrobium cyclopophantes]